MQLFGFMDAVLWQMRSSIFCEKARWALDYKGMPYAERNLRVAFHPMALRLRGRGTTVPVLDLDGVPVRGSSNIISAVEVAKPQPPLYPSDAAERRQVDELEAYFDEIGHEARRLVLWPLLQNRDVAAQTQIFGASSAELWFVRTFFPLVRRTVARRYGIDDRRTEQARDRILAALAEIEARTAVGGGYLVGGRFTAADLAAAALLAPVVMPVEYPQPPFDPAQIPAELTRMSAQFAVHPGCAWVREMYGRHRSQVAVNPDDG